MIALLDTQVWLWLTVDPDRVAEQVVDVLADPANDVMLSAASSWEIAIKYALGKLPLPREPAGFVPEQLRLQGIRPVAIEHDHVLRVASLPQHHRDPFDRLLVAQALSLGATIVTADPEIARYDVDVLAAVVS